MSGATYHVTTKPKYKPTPDEVLVIKHIRTHADAFKDPACRVKAPPILLMIAPGVLRAIADDIEKGSHRPDEGDLLIEELHTVLGKLKSIPPQASQAIVLSAMKLMLLPQDADEATMLESMRSIIDAAKELLTTYDAPGFVASKESLPGTSN
jgi:hypothetical protein